MTYVIRYYRYSSKGEGAHPPESITPASSPMQARYDIYRKIRLCH